jgi:putative transcriptional regulator
MELRSSNSRTHIAKELGITPQMLGAIERGDRDPSLRLAKKIADFYKVSIDEIFLPASDTRCYQNLVMKTQATDTII